jgi:hypothetical protein
MPAAASSRRRASIGPQFGRIWPSRIRAAADAIEIADDRFVDAGEGRASAKRVPDAAQAMTFGGGTRSARKGIGRNGARFAGVGAPDACGQASFA